jgi:two-component system, OmpR family, phosphate regulon response regulator PhoB
MTPIAKKVVIVEDEPDAAEMFAEMMRVSGYQVVKSYSSTPAISIIRNEMPDVVILDIMMPDVSGLEVLRYMRREPKLTHIPVVIVSAKSMPSDIKAGMDAGASMYLPKPVGFADLREAVERVIREAARANASAM